MTHNSPPADPIVLGIAFLAIFALIVGIMFFDKEVDNREFCASVGGEYIDTPTRNHIACRTFTDNTYHDQTFIKKDGVFYKQNLTRGDE